MTLTTRVCIAFMLMLFGQACLNRDNATAAAEPPTAPAAIAAPTQTRTVGTVNMLVQASHAAGVTAIALSPDNQQLVSVGKDGIAKLWGGDPPRLLRESRLCEYWLHAVTFVTSAQIAVSCGDGSIIIWEPSARDGGPSVALHTEKRYHRHMTVPYDSGSIVVASDDDGKLSAVDTTRNAVLWSAMPGTLEYIAPASQGVLIAYYKVRPARDTSPIMVLEMRRASDGQILQSMEVPGLYTVVWARVDASYNAFIRGMFYTPPGGASIQPLRAVNLATRSQVSLPEALLPKDYQSNFQPVTVDSNGRLLARVGSNIVRWKPGDERVETLPLPNAEQPTWRVASRDGHVIASISRGGALVRGELLGNFTASRFPDAARAISGLAVSPDDGAFAVGYVDGLVQVWSLLEGRPVIRRQLHPAVVHSLAFLDDDTVVSVGGDGKALRWNLLSGLQQEVASSGQAAFDSWTSLRLGTLCLREWKMDSCRRPAAPVITGIDDKVVTDSSFDMAALSRRSGQIALGGFKTLFIQDVGGGARREPVDSAGSALGSPVALAFSDSGRRLAVVASNQYLVLHIVAAASGRVEFTIPTPVATSAVKFISGTDDALIALLTDGSIVEINLGTPAQIATISPARPATGALAIAVSGDGNLVAVGDASGRIDVWDRTRSWARSALRGHVGMVASLAFLNTKPLLVSGALDGSLRLWNVRTGEALAQLASFGTDDWLVADDNGFFDGPESSWDRVLFETPQASAPLQPIRLTQLLFEPGLLANVSRTERSIKATLQARGDSRSKLDPLALAKRVPPQVTLQTRLRGDEAEVYVRAVDQGFGMRDLRVFRNGTRVSMFEGPLRAQNAAARTFEARVMVGLAPGSNDISAYAFDEAGVRSDDASAQITASAGSGRAMRIFAIGVGINTYSESAHMPQLNYAEADAEAFVTSLRSLAAASPQFEPDVRAKVLQGDAAIKANITAALRVLGDCNSGAVAGAWTADCPGPNDIVAVLFAGHGVQTDERFLFLPRDATASSPEQLQQTAVSDLDLEEALSGLDARRVYLVLDTCSSGKIAGDSRLRVGPFNGRGLAQLAYEKGIFILAATQSYRAALEAEQQGHGLLTYALVIDGLDRGNADFNDRDGELWDDEWLRYAVFKVPVLQRGVVEAKEKRGDLLFFSTEPVQDVRSLGNSQVPHLFRPSRRAFERLKLSGAAR